MKKILLILVLTLSFSAKAQTEDARFTGKKTVPLGVVESFHSKALNEKRVLNIYLPQGYHPDSLKTYPVIYLLDGSAHEDFPHIAGLAQFMNMYKTLPESIVVGIANGNRYKDFTYPSNDKRDLKEIPVSRSADFMEFLASEVQPFIEKNYKTTKHKTIIGQSLGGLLATEILLKKPQLFDDYIIVSPSLWWDEQRMLKKVEDYLSANDYSNKRVFLSVGKEHPVMNKVADKLAQKLKNVKGLVSFYHPILEENHATILHPAVFKAFKTLNTKEETSKK